MTAGANPVHLCGADGNMWFTESRGNRIGRITMAGVITEFSAGLTSGAGPAGIAAGPDGNLWFTEYDGNRIGRITPLGVVTEFSAGITAGALPSGITAGPDGNLWFTEYSGNRIGRITTGRVTEFSAGLTPGGRPESIARGPDGNLWFTESRGNRIGRITPDGVITEFSAGLSAGASPAGITAGPDGNLWFTEYDGNRIGRITVPPLLPRAENRSRALPQWHWTAFRLVLPGGRHRRNIHRWPATCRHPTGRREPTPPAPVARPMQQRLRAVVQLQHLGGGVHTAQLFVNGVPHGAATQFMVTAPAGEFLTGESKRITVPDFPLPGKSTVLVWQESLQNFAIESAGP
jgi:sugar lactone lactonase YvrE